MDRKDLFKSEFTVNVEGETVTVKSASNGCNYDKDLDPTLELQFDNGYILPVSLCSLGAAFPNLKAYYKVVPTYLKQIINKKVVNKAMGYLLQSKTPRTL